MTGSRFDQAALSADGTFGPSLRDPALGAENGGIAARVMRQSRASRRALEGQRSGSQPFSTVVVHVTLKAAADHWTHLERIAPISPYQQFSWAAAWMETEGTAAGLTPLIIVGLDPTSRPVVLLPFGLRRSAGLRRAVFLGGRQANYNLGLFDPRQHWTAADAEDLLRKASRLVPGRVDLYTLVHQPDKWAGFNNPLAGLSHRQPSPSFSHRAVLQPDGEAFLKAHQSAAARKKLRSKTAYLATLGPVTHRVARSPAEIAAVLSAHLQQKAAKLAAVGIAVPDLVRLRRFLDRACLPVEGRPAPVELHALYCGETVVATFGGLPHAGRFSGLLISHAGDPVYARASPGELLLTAVIRAKCAAGFEGLDLGIGEARYKDSLCPVADPLIDSFLPLTMVGRLAFALGSAKLRLKAAIKQSPRAWRAVQLLRKLKARLRP